MTGFRLFFRTFAVTGMVMVLDKHVHLDWWEGCVLSFGIMIILATLYDF